jgi:hypothetical protein
MCVYGSFRIEGGNMKKSYITPAQLAIEFGLTEYAVRAQIQKGRQNFPGHFRTELISMPGARRRRAAITNEDADILRIAAKMRAGKP